MNHTKIDRIKKMLVVLIIAVISSQAYGQDDQNKPKLTILIGLDQFRSSYLMEYNSAFTGGFRRMIDEGLWYQAAIVDHAPTLSLPGHTTLATGSNPKTHGITSNAWIDPMQEADSMGMINSIYPHLDKEVGIVGDETAHAFSGKKIKIEGLANWFRDADSNAKTVALSVSALATLYGGKISGQSSNNHVYWLNSSGRFVTSSYYRTDYPNWLKKFNSKIPEKYSKNHLWDNTIPERFQQLSRADEASYEYDGINTTFPHKAEDMIAAVSDEYYNWWFGRFSPYQNVALFDLAKESIKQLKLGQRSSRDFISIAVKLTDRIGHDFGPRSMEQMDVILRLDRILGDFLEYLDLTIGKGNYVIALSADHGAPNVSEYEETQNRKSHRISSSDVENALSSVDRLIENYSGPEKYLPDLIARNLERFPFIYKAMTKEDLENDTIQDVLIHAYRNSFRTDQLTAYPLWTKGNLYGNRVSKRHPANYGIVVEVSYNANIWSASSTHGSSHSYDREVPILFYGTNIQSGIASEDAFTRDIAPTLAKIAGINFPEVVDGKILDLK